MSTVPTLPGITSQMIQTDRIRTHVLFSGPEDGQPVVFIHGNLTNATWWEEVMVSLPDGFRAIAPDQRGYGEADPAKKIDATRGMGDLADDAFALLDALGVEKAHVVGNSLGGSVVWRMMMDAPQRLLSVTQAAPGSPYGFACTKDVAGTPCFDDFAGSGAGLINPEVVKSLAAGDRSADSPFTARSALRTLIVKPPFIPAREEELVSAMLTTHLGEQDYPGDLTPSPNWPFVAPGVWGANNALSPKYLADPAGLYAIDPKPPLLWIRGDHDQLVSDHSLADPGTLGAMGLIPDWPGEEVYPSQPMIGQTRAVLDRYAAAGGAYEEVVMADVAHVPFIENLDEFNRHFHAHLRSCA